MINQDTIDKYWCIVIDNYHDLIINEGWVMVIITTAISSDTKISYLYNVHPSVYSNITQKDAILKASEHGIICDEFGNVINIDEQKFNDTLYLWQAQELGIL